MFSLTKVIVAAGFAATSAVAFSGDLTYYSPGLGACGTTAGEGDAVVALSAVEYGNDPNPNNSPVCNKDINISCKLRPTRNPEPSFISPSNM